MAVETLPGIRPAGMEPVDPLIGNGLPPKAASSPVALAIDIGIHPRILEALGPRLIPEVVKKWGKNEVAIREALEALGNKTPEERLFEQRVVSYQKIGELVEPGVMGSHEWLWEIGKFFQNERLKLRMSQPELARRACFTDDTIRHLEAGWGHEALGIYDGRKEDEHKINPFNARNAVLPRAIARALGDEEGIHKKFLIQFGLMTSEEANKLYEKPKPKTLPPDYVRKGFQPQLGYKIDYDEPVDLHALARDNKSKKRGKERSIVFAQE